MNGYKRFDYYLSEIEKLIQKGKNAENFGEHLLQANLRTPFFMMEGLARVYSALYEDTWLEKLKDQIKEVEDALGVADHFVMTLKTFEAIPEIPTDLKQSLQSKIPESFKSLEVLLTEKGWMNGTRIKKIRKKLSAINWMKEKKEIKALYEFYITEIDEIATFYTENAAFTDMEEHVHEFRRKLRWLSIYATSMRGAVQLINTALVDKSLNKYLTDETVHSPYNVLPEHPTQRYSLLLEQNRFYALSWLIKEVGQIKDFGLMNEIIAGENVPNPEGWNAPEKMNDGLLQKANAICKAFMEEQHLEKLVMGIGKN